MVMKNDYPGFKGYMLSKRVYNLLIDNNIKSRRQLTKKKVIELSSLPGVGCSTMDMIVKISPLDVRSKFEFFKQIYDNSSKKSFALK